MFVFALKKANICRTLGPKNEHCPSHLTCRPNITNSALSHNTLHATLRGELASVGVYRSVTGNIISYTQRYGSHPTQRRVLASRNWSQKKAPLSQGLVGGREKEGRGTNMSTIVLPPSTGAWNERQQKLRRQEGGKTRQRQ